jgi:hypothetical protein
LRKSRRENFLFIRLPYNKLRLRYWSRDWREEHSVRAQGYS